MPQKPNYAAALQALLATMGTQRKTLALHACCAPCSTAVLEQLAQHFDITIVYYNPNTWPEAEWQRRGDELQRFVATAGIPNLCLEYLPHQPQDFYSAVQGLEAQPERGSRCTVCYRLRLAAAAQYAAAHQMDAFCSTLSISPHKDAVRINQIGEALAQRYGVPHLPNDFKKAEGYKRSLVLSAQYGLYRQNYCGCQFSAQGCTGAAATPPLPTL